MYALLPLRIVPNKFCLFVHAFPVLPPRYTKCPPKCNVRCCAWCGYPGVMGTPTDWWKLWHYIIHGKPYCFSVPTCILRTILPALDVGLNHSTTGAVHLWDWQVVETAMSITFTQLLGTFLLLYSVGMQTGHGSLWHIQNSCCTFTSCHQFSYVEEASGHCAWLRLIPRLGDEYRIARVRIECH